MTPPFTTGPGNTAVATCPDPRTGEETYVTRTSAPGQPPAEYQLYLELRNLGIKGEAVTSLHTDLSPSDLPGGYTYRFVKSVFPNAALSCTQTYGPTAEARTKAAEAVTQQAAMMSQLIGQQPAPPPLRAPVQTAVPPAAPVPDQVLGGYLTQIFGPQGVRRYDTRNTRLPAPTQATLGWAGLPTDIPLFFTADTPETPPPGGFLTDAATHLRTVGTTASAEVLTTLTGHTRIGTDGTCAITIQCDAPPATNTAPGQIWAIKQDGTGRQVNTSLSAFLRSLLALVTTRHRMTGQDPRQAGAAVAALQHELTAIDPTALTEENWWSVILEQMWHGLF